MDEIVYIAGAAHLGCVWLCASTVLVVSPAGSTAPAVCGSAAVYCLGGVLYNVPVGTYSTPEAGSATNRTGAASCKVSSSPSAC